MLSYLHGFHAGNFADVHKHLVLALVLDYLLKKDTPLAVVDVYAGAGFYDLADARASKTGEAEQGIRALPDKAWPDAAAPYREVVRRAAGHQWPPRLYPGSPQIAADLTRSKDRLVFNELHPREYEALKARFANDARVHVHHRDALEALVALVPPPEKRGLVLIDPSYEVKDEYRTVPEALARAEEKWPTGVFLLWYPLLAGGAHHPFVQQVERLTNGPLLQTELCVRPPGAGMYGSGMMVLNAPWTLTSSLESLRGWLAQLQQPGGVLRVNVLRQS
ncbi:MAG: 23S rRNA (adenine(2030)-N(6))-methyltransferase RlmJ [Alcanivoracaceae bacterium]